MAYKRIKTEDMDANFKFACRCCLKSEAEFYKLDALTDSSLDDNDASSTKIPYIRLLLFCMRTENLPELPQIICVDCTKTLKIAYFFIQNALRAHEILCRKICPGKIKTTARFNGQQQQSLSDNIDEDDATVGTSYRTKPQKSPVGHGCKICGAIIYNRLELKQHIRMHAEESRHSCKMCNYVTLKLHQLPEHYRRIHGLTAIQIEQQLKRRRTMQSKTSPLKSSGRKNMDDGQVKVCTLEDMELLIPTVLTPEDFSHPIEQFRDIEQQLTNSKQTSVAEATVTASGGGNMSIGAEFLVMPDGSLQQVNDGGVVFEYIDDSKNTNTSTNMTLQNLLSDSKPNANFNSMDVDVNDLATQETPPQIIVKSKPRPGPASIGALKHKCKLCPKAFPTVARLKSHQLTHSHLPKFYCDQCPYFTLRSVDLIQHYTDIHNGPIGEISKSCLMERSPKSQDRSRIYSCDMCLYDTPSCSQLRTHYSDKHLIQPSEVQLRPSWVNESKDKFNSSIDSNQSATQPAIPLGIKYPPAAAVSAETTTSTPTVQLQPGQATTTAMITPTGDINVVVDATSLFYAAAGSGASSTTTTTATAVGSTDTIATDPNAFAAMFPTQSLLPSSAAGPAAGTNSSIFGDMQEFIDNTDVAAICTIPADDMPVVDGDDIVIDNNNISLDFDAENLFEEFDEDVEVGDEDDEDDEDAENDDENDNNDAAADQNLLLTSDDDDVDDFDDEQSKHLQKPYCIYCNKKFTSQYKFENHMFVHRGLAPYRCELCTNLYNMKRLLIRHYKTVHKRMPTRDMVQAKGDKVSVARTTIEKIYTNNDKAPLVMCAKCPYECEQESEMRKHLNAHHGINEGVTAHANEVFIIRKLPFECPRCIRSFAAKHTLTRHLQRSHLVDTIIEMQAPQLTTSSAITTTTTTATTTLPKNTGEEDVINASESIDNNCEGDGNGEGVEKCEERLLNPDSEDVDNTETDKKETQDIDTMTTTTATATATEIAAETALKIETNPERPITAIVDKTIVSTVTTTTTTIADATIKTNDEKPNNVDSSLYPTPTPFDFDLDFIGEGPQATPLKTKIDSFDVMPSQLLNGSDKLLTAALEPSPIKDLRTRLPRTPIFVCKQCNQTFDELGKLLQHELDQHSSGTLSPHSSYQHQCTICNTTYRTVTLLNYHMKRHAMRKVECKKCPKEFTSTSELEQHVDTEHRGKTILLCGEDGCTKTFNYKHHLKRHQTASHTPVQYICPECGKDMMTSLHLRNHRSMHRGTHSYKCPKCVRTYMRRNPFRRHALREHKWELTDEDMNEIYSANETPSSIKLRSRKSIKVENEESD